MSASSLSLPQGKSVSLKQFVSRHINEIGLLVVIAILYLVFYMNASRLQGFRSFDIDGRLQLYIRPCCSHEAAGPYVIR